MKEELENINLSEPKGQTMGTQKARWVGRGGRGGVAGQANVKCMVRQHDESQPAIDHFRPRRDRKFVQSYALFALGHSRRKQRLWLSVVSDGVTCLTRV